MATLLHRLGRTAFHRRKLVLGIWAALLVLLGAGAATLSGQLTNSISIPGTESQRAIDKLEQRFPQAAQGAGARIAVAAPEGEKLTQPDNRAALQAVVAELRAAPQVKQVVPPLKTKMVSPDGRIALVQVSYDVQPFQLTESDREALQDAAQPGEQAGLQVEFSGNAMQAAPETGLVEVIGVAVAAVVLVITFGSLLAAGLPLLTGLLGAGIGIAGIFTASGFIDLNANTPILALMIALAVGIDYALLIVSRYRHELTSGREPEDAAAHATGTAGSAVLFAGLTVMIALAGLTVVGIPFLTQMGVAAAAGVAVTVLIALTLLPAVLGFAGKRVLGGRIPGLRGKQTSGPTLGTRWAGFVSRHRIAVLAVALIGLLTVAAPALSMRLGLPNASTAAPESTKHQAYELISQGFGEGTNGPLTVVLDAGSSDSPQQAAQAAAGMISGLDNVARVAPPRFNTQGDTAILSVIPGTGPSSEATKDLVHEIRAHAGELAQSTGAELSVTGQTAMNIDISEKLSDAMLPYLVLIVGLAFLLLMLVFRSVIVPLKATLGFLGSVAAAFGAVVAVYQWGWLSALFGIETTAPIMSMLPILLIGVLFGLAMDYQVFLVSRMREEYVHGAEPRQAMVTGFGHGSRVVVAAALIMTSVFAGFVFADNRLIGSIGFALAFGIAVDAFVIRMTIVPAVLALLGKHAWWLPKWLDNVLPNVDIEGEKLRAESEPIEPRAKQEALT